MAHTYSCGTKTTMTHLITQIVCSHRSGATFEDLTTWLVCVAPTVMNDVGLHPDLLRMWDHLSRGLLYFLRYSEGQHTPNQILTAQNHLLRYAVLAETAWTVSHICTLQLHVAVVHLAVQCLLCGVIAFLLEAWVERTQQVVKRITKYRATKFPEVVAVSYLLQQWALQKQRHDHPELRDDAPPDHPHGVEHDGR